MAGGSGSSSGNHPANTSLYVECKKLHVLRCFYACLYSATSQFLLLTTFLLFAHFSPLHPLGWLLNTIAALLSWRTWLSLVPLLAAVAGHGFLLGKSLLHTRQFHRHRCARILQTGGRQAAMLAVHSVIGATTAWLYARFLPGQYGQLYAECPDERDSFCLNERYAFLVIAGCYTGIYYFVRERCREPTLLVEFPLVQQARYLEMRANLYEIFALAVRTAVVPCGSFVVCGFMLGRVFADNVALVCGLRREVDTLIGWHLFDPLQLLFMFIISVQICFYMRLMDHLLIALLTERRQFPVEPSQLADPRGQTEITLVQALNATEVPIVAQLAAFDLIAICEQTPAAAKRRQLVYALSVPGGHPHNWTALFGQCVRAIDAFRVELQTAVDRALQQRRTVGVGVSEGRSPPAAPSLLGRGAANGGLAHRSAESVAEWAAKVQQRQYNEAYGIRNMMASAPDFRQLQAMEEEAERQRLEAAQSDPCRRFNEGLEWAAEKRRRARAAMMRLPGISYLFGVDETARVAHLLSGHAERIANTVHGIAGLAVHSLREDRYGVVQSDLARLVSTLLKLRAEIAKVASIPFLGGIIGGATVTGGGGQSLVVVSAQQNERVVAHRRWLGLCGTVGRSLCELGAVFGEYLPDLLDDAHELRQMESFAEFRET